MIFLGTPIGRKDIDELEEEEIAKLKNNEKQNCALDSKGKRRFQGTFTEGNFNTIESKEGWTPSSFTSSRKNRAERKEQTINDFIDEQDREENILKDGVKVRKEFALGEIRRAENHMSVMCDVESSILSNKFFDNTTKIDTEKQKLLSQSLVFPLLSSIGLELLKLEGYDMKKVKNVLKFSNTKRGNNSVKNVKVKIGPQIPPSMLEELKRKNKIDNTKKELNEGSKIEEEEEEQQEAIKYFEDIRNQEEIYKEETKTQKLEALYIKSLLKGTYNNCYGVGFISEMMNALPGSTKEERSIRSVENCEKEKQNGFLNADGSIEDEERHFNEKLFNMLRSNKRKVYYDASADEDEECTNLIYGKNTFNTQHYFTSIGCEETYHKLKKKNMMSILDKNEYYCNEADLVKTEQADFEENTELHFFQNELQENNERSNVDGLKVLKMFHKQKFKDETLNLNNFAKEIIIDKNFDGRHVEKLNKEIHFESKEIRQYLELLNHISLLHQSDQTDSKLRGQILGESYLEKCQQIPPEISAYCNKPKISSNNTQKIGKKNQDKLNSNAAPLWNNFSLDMKKQVLGALFPNKSFVAAGAAFEIESGSNFLKKEEKQTEKALFSSSSIEESIYDEKRIRRNVTSWHPDKLLCKRWNVIIKNTDDKSSSFLQLKESASLFAPTNLLPPNKDMTLTASSQFTSSAALSKSGSMGEKTSLSLPPIPSVDLFRAIFDSDNEENDRK